MSSGTEQRHFDDRAGLCLLAGLVLIAAGFRFHFDNWISDFDMTGFFMPTFGYIGDRLADFQLPIWNPHEQSGAPAMGNPSGGWLYLPVMVLFPLFEVILAFKLMVVVQCLIAAVSTYFFSRRIGLLPLSATITGTCYATMPVLGTATTNATIYAQAICMIPVALLGLECALRAESRVHRLAWSALAALGLSQIFAAWPSQGALYAGGLIGGWGVYRLALPLDRGESEGRIAPWRGIEVAVAIGILAAGFSASLIVSLLSFSEQSTIPGGDYSNVIGGDYASYSMPPRFLFELILKDYVYWRGNLVSAALLILGVYGLLRSGIRQGAAFFAVTSFVLLDIAAKPSLFRGLLDLVPLLEHTHGHRPLASVIFTSFGIIMLGGIGLDRVQRAEKNRFARLLVLVGMALFAYLTWYFREQRTWIGARQVWIAAIASALVLAPLLPGIDRLGATWRRTAPAWILAGLVLFYPGAWDIGTVLRNPSNAPDWTSSFGRDQIVADVVERSMARTDPGTVVDFLQAQERAIQPFRYAPFTGVYDGTAQTSSTALRLEAEIIPLLANGRSMRLGLESITGYNPLHLKYYADYIDAINEGPQDYHWLDLMSPALEGTQLLDMLNVKYAVLPRSLEPKPAGLVGWIVAFQDENTVVFENPNAFPRAWVVHNVRAAQDGAELELFDSGQVSGRRTAFVHGDLPSAYTPPTGSPAESVVVLSEKPEQLSMRVTASADGLLVVSQPYTHGWNAYVDGDKVEVQRTNHALQGIPVTAGQHEVVLKYEPRELTIGLWSTGLTSVAIIGIWCWAGLDRWGRRRRGNRG